MSEKEVLKAGGGRGRKITTDVEEKVFVGGESWRAVMEVYSFEIEIKALCLNHKCTKSQVVIKKERKKN